jgi:hypothetical protein
MALNGVVTVQGHEQLSPVRGMLKQDLFCRSSGDKDIVDLSLKHLSQAAGAGSMRIIDTAAAPAGKRGRIGRQLSRIGWQD